MSVKDKLFDPSVPLKFFELVPPAAEKPEAVQATLTELKEVGRLADAVNLPEIRDESRDAPRTARFVPRVEPRLLGARIRRDPGLEVVVNRCVVYEPDQLRWFEETRHDFGLETVVLVGGESSKLSYPGPSVLEAAEQVRLAQPEMCLGGITIPSRVHEAERIRRKNSAGLDFFTTQILFDSNDIVWLVQQLNGLEARVFLSFAPVSHPRDLEFLRWLGADIPDHLDGFLLRGDAMPSDPSHGAETSASDSANRPSYLDRSLDLAQRILTDVFDNLPPDPPPLGLNIEHVNQRNFQPALRMLEHLGNLYSELVAARARPPGSQARLATASGGFNL
jgi:5,10-methylenetetrahydrofolate reductase